MHRTVTPAYGRDYKSKAAALYDWHDGLDFILQPDGCYIGKGEADTAGFQVMLRYNKLTRTVSASEAPPKDKPAQSKGQRV